MHNLLFCVHALCMNYETNTLLLVSSSVRSKQLLCFVHGQGQKSEQKPTTKSFDEFHNHSPLLTMMLLYGYASSGLRVTSRNKNLYLIPYNEFTDQTWGQDGWMLASFFFCLFMKIDCVSVNKNTKKNVANTQPS